VARELMTRQDCRRAIKGRHRRKQTADMNSSHPAERRAERGLMLAFAVMSLGIVMGGVFYYRHYERQFRDEAELKLAAVANLKVDELVQYRKERLEDANNFYNNSMFSGLVRRFLGQPADADAQR
jgi:hypothetical protein